MSEGEEETVADCKRLIPIFISYRWNETKDEVRQFAAYLKSLNRFDVWIDKQEMYGDKNERMEEGIRNSRIVVIFFNDDYQKSRDCRKEAESADRNGKDIVFVKMQRAKCPLLSWFAPIISSNIFVDFYKFQNPAEEILKHIDKLLLSANVEQHVRSTSYALSQKLVTCKVPKFLKYQTRPGDEQNVLEAVQKICNEDAEIFQGALVVCGGGGSGKTTLVAQLVQTHAGFLRNQCCLNGVVWLNCFKWAHEDEAEFVRSLVELAEKAGDFTAGGSRKLEDVCAQLERQNERLLVILDDVFNVRLLETMHDHCTNGNIVCIAVTRDVDQLTQTHGLVHSVYRLQELSDDLLVEMLENAYRLEGKLSREKLGNLAKHCSGLPIVASLIAARFQDCETSRDFAAEYDTLTRDVKVGDLKIAGPYGTVSKLFAFSLEQQEDDFRKMYYAFLLFDPAHPVDVEDLAILWQCPNQHRALVQCRQLAKKSLARPVIGGSDFYLIHQLLHEAAVDNAIKTHQLAKSLPDLQTKIVCRFSDDADETLIRILNQALVQQRKQLLERIFDLTDIAVLWKSLRKRCEISERQPFLLYLYNFKLWPDNGPPVPFGVNHSYRLLHRLFTRINGDLAAISNDEFIDVLKEKDASGNCFLYQIFSEHYVQEHWSDRWRVADSLKPRGCYRIFNQLDWLKKCKESPTPNSALFLAAANGDNVDLLRRLVQEKPGDLLLARNGDGEIPLMAAARFGYFENIKFLVETCSESVDIVSNDKRNAFMLAAYNGNNVEAVQFLYERTKNALQRCDTKGKNALSLAAMNGNFEVVRFLLMCSCDPDSISHADNDSRTALIFACRYGHFDIVKYLLQLSTNPAELKNAVDINGMTPLHFAAGNGHLDVVKYFCDPMSPGYDKAQLQSIDQRGTTAFMMAARRGRVDIVEYLYDHGCGKEVAMARQNDGKTALIIAAERNHLNVCQFLYEKLPAQSKAELLRLRDKFGKTALMSAARYGHVDVVRFLYDVDTMDDMRRFNDAFYDANKKVSQETALILAVRYGHVDTVRLLVEKLLAHCNECDDTKACEVILNEAIKAAEETDLDNIASFLDEQRQKFCQNL